MSAMQFEDFLAFFPEVDLPITLSEEMVLTFSSTNKPFPPAVLEEWILTVEKETDDLTEYIPCFRLKDTKDFTAIVYWKGSLLKYEFVLVTYDTRQSFICRRSLASVIGEGDLVKKSIAVIDEDLIINIVAGENSEEDSKYNPKNSKAFSMEIQPNGQVIFSADS